MNTATPTETMNTENKTLCQQMDNSVDPLGENRTSISTNHMWRDNWDHWLHTEINFTDAPQPYNQLRAFILRVHHYGLH